MFKIEVADTNVSGGSIPITWCLDHELISQLAEKEIYNPQLVIITSPVNNYHAGKEQRKVVPLKDLIAYIDFHHVGEVNIWAFISLGSNVNSVKTSYLSKMYGIYSTSLLDFEGKDWCLFADATENRRTEKPLVVDVPKECFAKEPPAWEKAWVNAFFVRDADNQCDYRRRRFLAYTLQPIIMFFNILLRTLITLISLILGFRGFNLNYVLHPLTHNLDSSCGLFSGGTVFIPKLEDDSGELDGIRNNVSYFIRKTWKLPLMPPVALILFCIYLTHKIILLTVICISVSIFLSLLVGLVWFIECRSDVFKWFNTKFNKKVWYEDKEEIDLLICSNNKKTFSTLPAKKKTIKLRFLDLKSKVCRPFAG
jgi:hypothetical protein